MGVLEYASERLKSSKEFVLKVLEEAPLQGDEPYTVVESLSMFQTNARR